MHTYDYLEIEKVVREQDRNGHVQKLSDWNTTSKDVAVPDETVRLAFETSLRSQGKESGTSDVADVCQEIAKSFSVEENLQFEMHLFGSGTQAISMLFYALRELVKTRRRSSKKPTVVFLSPTYFSAIQAAETYGFEVSEVYRSSLNSFGFALEELEARIRDLHSNGLEVYALFVTEPIYSAGVRTPIKELRSLAEFCQFNGIRFFVDGSTSGLIWNDGHNWMDKELVSLTKLGANVVDSLSKKLFFANTKIGVIYGQKEVVELARLGSDLLAGNVTAMQMELARLVFSKTKSVELEISRCITANLKRFKTRYKVLSDALNATPYRLITPESGYHVVVLSNTLRTNHDVDAMQWSRALLCKGAFALPTLDFRYAPLDPFGFRVTLTKDLDFATIREVTSEII
jgi:aspartate/methionine/tyrosine aminotransferase